MDIDMVLHNDHVTLRAWKSGDARWYVEARDEEVFAWTTESRTLTVEETIAAIEKLPGRTDCVSFAITDTRTQELLGNIALVLDLTDTSAEIMYWLAPIGRGRGIASQAVGLLCRWGFSELGLTEVSLQTHRDNWRSQRVAERAGFQSERLSETGRTAEKVWYRLRRAEGAC